MLKIPISEIFFSIQGEGLLQGIPSVLVRLSGCNLNCAWCDSKMKSSYVVSFEELINQISKYNCKDLNILFYFNFSNKCSCSNYKQYIW